MANLTELALIRNGSVTLTFANGAASQEIELKAPDEKYVLEVQNTDPVTALIRIEGGDYSGGVLGVLDKQVVQNAYAVLGPLEGTRFKDSAGKFSVLILGVGGGAYGGTVTAVKLGLLRLP